MNKFLLRLRQQAVGKGLCSVTCVSGLSALSFPEKGSGPWACVLEDFLSEVM